MQEQIVTFRTNRVTNFKRVFPKLTIANGFDAHEGEREEEPVKGGEKTLGLTGRTRGKRKGKVSEAVAPKTMFLHMKGSNNADVIQTVATPPPIFIILGRCDSISCVLADEQISESVCE